jgi:hypothetical protein
MTELLILAPADGHPIHVDTAFGGYVGRERTHYAKVVWPGAVSLSEFGPLPNPFEIADAMYDVGEAPYAYDGELSVSVRLPKPQGSDWLIRARFLPRFGVTVHDLFGPPDQMTTVLVLAGYVPPSEEVRLLPLGLVQAIAEPHR